MPRWFRALFAWRTIRDSGVYLYQENAITGARRATQYWFGGWQPLDRNWLARLPPPVMPYPPPPSSNH